MADEARGATKRSLTWLWMVLGVLSVVAFLTWISVASEPSSVVVMEDDTTQAGDEVPALEAGVTEVSKDSLGADKARYAGQRIRVQGVQATGTLGPAVFWGELGDPSRQIPLLVRMDSALAAQGLEIRTGASYMITGELQRMTDSVATAWGEAGLFANDDAQAQATFADYFLNASTIRPSRGGAPAGDAAGGAGER